MKPISAYALYKCDIVNIMCYIIVVLIHSHGLHFEQSKIYVGAYFSLLERMLKYLTLMSGALLI